MPLPINLWLVHPSAEMCLAFQQHFHQLPNVQIIQGRFEELPPHDCFITAANSFGIMTAGIDAAIIQIHGEDLMKKVQHRILNEYLGEQPIGTCFIESTGNEQYPFIGHAPTMRVPQSITGTDNIYMATRAGLVAVYRHNIRSEEKINTIVLPAMGTGFGGVSYDEAARQMGVAYRHYLSPPHRLDWEEVLRREQAICYDNKQKVVRR